MAHLSPDWYGPWDENSAAGIPSLAGLYFVCESRADSEAESAPSRVTRVLEAGRAPNVNQQVNDSASITQWRSQLAPSGRLVFWYLPA